jgi:hypothetical protein
MDNRELYSIIAGILPPLLGLGLVEIYIERDVSPALIVASLVALAVLIPVTAAFVDLAESSRRQPRRRRRRASRV